MRVLISGGAGFLASHLSDLLLSQGHDVLGVDNFITGKQQNIEHLLKNPHYQFMQADVIEPLKIDSAVDRIYHMASPASPIGYVKQQIATVKVNSQGTWNLLELSLEKGARFLMASTSECYGDPTINPQREDYWGNVNPIGLRSMYDEPKRFSEACTMAYHRERGADTRIIRIFNTYGPRMDPYDGRVVISFIRQALNNEPLTVFGEGKQTRSLCYVTDLVRGINLVMEKDFIEPINLGNPEEVTILQIAKDILALIPESKSSITFHPMPPDDPRVRCPDIARAKQVLGWSPTVSRSEGLKKMIDFYRDQLVALSEIDEVAMSRRQQLAYLALGSEEILLETRYALVQAFARSVASPDVVVCTDQPERFDGWPIRTLQVDPTLQRDWRGPQDFSMRMKIRALLTLMDQSDKTLLVDADTLFLQDPATVFDRIDARHTVLHVNEGALDRLPTHRRISRRITDAARAVGLELGSELWSHLQPSQRMWNAGVVGVHREHRPIVEQVLRFTDALYARTQWYFAEQFAFSVMLPSQTTVRDARQPVEHYWNRIPFPGWHGGKPMRELYHDQARMFFAAQAGQTFDQQVAALRSDPPKLYRITAPRRWLAAVLRRTVARR